MKPATAPRAGEAARAAATLPMTLIDASLRRRAVVVSGFRAGAGGELEFTAAGEGAPAAVLNLGGRAGSADAPLALAPASWSTGEGPTVMPLMATGARAGARQPAPGAGGASGWLSTVDGQRFPGTIPAGAEPSEDALVWEHPGFGAVSVPLDDLSVVALGLGVSALDVEPEAAATSTDRLLLFNGDTLSGFVAALGSSVVLEATPPSGAAKDEGKPREVEIPLERVADVRLSGSRRNPAGARLWLADGSVVAVKSVRDSSRQPGRLVFEPALGAPVARSEGSPGKGTNGRGEAAIFAENVLAVVGDASGLVPLSALDSSGVAPAGDRRRVEPPRRSTPGALGAADILLSGPMVAEWVLPEGASRIAGEAVLHPDAGVWGDCEIAVEALGSGEGAAATVLATGRVSVASPTMTFNAPIEGVTPGSRLRVRIGPGNYGPVQDVVVLRNVLIRVVR